MAYVILDSFDLGVGILFGAAKEAQLREQMVAAISPFWDGNETWLVVVGASLFAAFPIVYAVFLPAFYLPVLLLLLGLISRGVAFAGAPSINVAEGGTQAITLIERHGAAGSRSNS